jgi:hypothetical protein
MGGRLTGAALLGVVAILGMRFYSKASARDDVRARLVSLCATDTDCLGDVRKHYDACFESAYKAGGSGAASRLDVDGLVRCVNTRSGVPYFAVYEEEKRP